MYSTIIRKNKHCNKSKQYYNRSIMSQQKFSVGIDIGSSQIKVIVAEKNPKGDVVVLGTGIAESKGLRRGYISNIEETSESIKRAIAQAEKTSGVNITRAFVSTNDANLSSIVSWGSATTTKADREITDMDIEKAINDSEIKIQKVQKDIASTNREIIFDRVIAYKVDGVISLEDPIGIIAEKVEVQTLFITCPKTHLNNIYRAVERAGVAVLEIIPSPLIAILPTLEKKQRRLGCVLANIGAETTSIVVYEEDIPISLEIFKVGSNDITNDISLSFKIQPDEAEKVKLGISQTVFNKRQLEETIFARLSDIFESIENNLKTIGKNGLLPAGIIFTGGGANLAGIEVWAKANLQLPARIAVQEKVVYSPTTNNKIMIRDPKWSVAYGLAVYGLLGDEQQSVGRFSSHFKSAFRRGLEWIKQFLP
jgi:cell division protein FtsA